MNDQVNQVVLCGKVAVVRGGGGGTDDTSVAVSGRGGSGPGAGPRGAPPRTALALERWAEALRMLNAKVVAKVNHR